MEPPAYSRDSLPGYSKPEDALPNYKPSLQYFGMSLMKTEFLTPFHYNNKRTWKPVLLELNSTQLNVWSLNVDSNLEKLLLALFNYQNQLNELVNNVNNEYSKKTSGELPDNLSLLQDLDDLFAGDAYGGEFSQDFYKISAKEKLKNKLLNKKFSKSLNGLSKYYLHLKDNGFMFEPVNDYGRFTRFMTKYGGELVHRFTLDNLNVGEAPSLNQLISALYKEDHIKTKQQNTSTLVKYKNCLRLRIECKQILLQFWSFNAMIQWFRNLNIGRDLCLPLESRRITKLKSIPNRNNSRNNALLTATAAAALYDRRDNLYEPVLPSPEFTAYQNKLDSSQASISSDSIFSDVNESISSNESLVDSNYVTINNFKLLSYDKLYTILEKQYISNCIPDLNSYDKWSGLDLTLSNFDKYVSNNKPQDNDLFISYDALYDNDRKKNRNVNLNCRRFLIHQNGLVSVTL